MSRGPILHINAVGLMAAIEEARDAGLRARPFVVAREGAARAIVLDLSPAAHREGIRRGMMLSAAARRLPGLLVREPRPDLYRSADEALWRIAMTFSPLVERAGQGHLYVDLTGTSRLNGPPEDASQRMRLRVIEETGLNPSLALASNKTVAKVATRVFRPTGFVALLPHEEGPLVRLQPVELLPGVGPALRDRLALLDIECIGSLADLGPAEARAIGQRGPELVNRARCLDVSPVNPEPPERRLLRGSSCLEPDTADIDLLRLHAAWIAATLGFAMRKEGLGARRARVRLEYSDGIGREASERSQRLLARDDEIGRLAWAALARAFDRRVRVRRIAVELMEFDSAGPELDLFDPRESRSDRLQRALDSVHRKYGFSALEPCVFLRAGLLSGRSSS